jgi:hypothetical protein
MEPKLKAKELYDKFYMAIPSDEMGLCDKASRQCALIAVDELIADEHLESGDSPYWIEVKQEIEKL